MDAICGSYSHNLVMVDGTSIRVHHAAATVKKTVNFVVWEDQEEG